MTQPTRSADDPEEARKRALEFGEYLANGAERFMHAINDYDSGSEPDLAVRTEAWRRLQRDIYEFRKRAKRAKRA